MKLQRGRKTIIGIMSIIAPALWCLAAASSFAESTNTPPVKNDSQQIKTEELTPDQAEEPVAGAAESYPEETAFIVSGEGLIETPSPVEDGGVMIDLQGRFRSPRTAVIGPDGKVHIGHEPHEKIKGEKTDKDKK